MARDCSNPRMKAVRFTLRTLRRFSAPIWRTFAVETICEPLWKNLMRNKYWVKTPKQILHGEDDDQEKQVHTATPVREATSFSKRPADTRRVGLPPITKPLFFLGTDTKAGLLLRKRDSMAFAGSAAPPAGLPAPDRDIKPKT